MIIKNHIAHFKKMFWHKVYVFDACWRLGVPFWRALFHDWTKYTPAEWHGYVKHFYNPDGSTHSIRRADGSYDPSAQPADFQSAWLHHQQRNKHHWQAWCVIGDNGQIKPLPIPFTYLLEMVADWIGAGRAYESGEWNFLKTMEWWKVNGKDMVLHDISEKRLSIIMLMIYWGSEFGDFSQIKRCDMKATFRKEMQDAIR